MKVKLLAILVVLVSAGAALAVASPAHAVRGVALPGVWEEQVDTESKVVSDEVVGETPGKPNHFLGYDEDGTPFVEIVWKSHHAVDGYELYVDGQYITSVTRTSAGGGGGWIRGYHYVGRDNTAGSNIDPFDYETHYYQTRAFVNNADGTVSYSEPSEVRDVTMVDRIALITQPEPAADAPEAPPELDVAEVEIGDGEQNAVTGLN